MNKWRTLVPVREQLHWRSSSGAGVDLVHCPDPPSARTRSLSQLAGVLAAADFSWSPLPDLLSAEEKRFSNVTPLSQPKLTFIDWWMEGGCITIQPCWPNLGLLWRVSPLQHRIYQASPLGRKSHEGRVYRQTPVNPKHLPQCLVNGDDLFWVVPH